MLTCRMLLRPQAPLGAATPPFSTRTEHSRPTGRVKLSQLSLLYRSKPSELDLIPSDTGTLPTAEAPASSMGQIVFGCALSHTRVFFSGGVLKYLGRCMGFWECMVFGVALRITHNQTTKGQAGLLRRLRGIYITKE
jgi:hypothetical protein